MPPPFTSFYHALYKRLWIIAQQNNVHLTAANSYGGFSLRSPGEPNGIFGTITTDPYNGFMPLHTGDSNPDTNPLYALLKRSLDPAPPFSMTVNNQTWPVMPYPWNNSNANYPNWTAWNDASQPVRFIDAMHDWILLNNKLDDTPGGAHLEFADWSGGPAAFPLAKGKSEQILFVCSTAGDNGVRPGTIDPNNFWNTSQIFVCNDHGKNIGLPPFKPGEQRIIHALIGNSGNINAGAVWNLPPIEVRCNAYVFNTFLSDPVRLPEMSALDAANAGFTYEQPLLQSTSYGVAGFRFDVDLVFKALRDAMIAHPYTPAQLGFPTVDDWLKANGSHACVKVLVRADEYPNNQMGGFPDAGVAVPTSDRHIAQRNLAPFDMSVVAMKKIKWQYFMMSQAGAGTNALAIQQAWTTGSKGDAARFYLALPPQMWARYGAKAKHRGFEVVHDAEPKPFPDAVILRETAPGAKSRGARLELLDHARERFFGMALGIEGDPARLKSVRGDLSVVHTAHDGHVVGGFTLRPEH